MSLNYTSLVQFKTICAHVVHLTLNTFVAEKVQKFKMNLEALVQLKALHPEAVKCVLLTFYCDRLDFYLNRSCPTHLPEANNDPCSLMQCRDVRASVQCLSLINGSEILVRNRSH